MSHHLVATKKSSPHARSRHWLFTFAAGVLACSTVLGLWQVRDEARQFDGAAMHYLGMFSSCEVHPATSWPEPPLEDLIGCTTDIYDTDEEPRLITGTRFVTSSTHLRFDDRGFQVYAVTYDDGDEAVWRMHLRRLGGYWSVVGCSVHRVEEETQKGGTVS